MGRGAERALPAGSCCESPHRSPVSRSLTRRRPVGEVLLPALVRDEATPLCKDETQGSAPSRCSVSAVNLGSAPRIPRPRGVGRRPGSGLDCQFSGAGRATSGWTKRPARALSPRLPSPARALPAPAAPCPRPARALPVPCPRPARCSEWVLEQWSGSRVLAVFPGLLWSLPVQQEPAMLQFRMERF